ncbi:MAG: hypothetical protein NWP79_02315 [Paracoccaceae bacterium]|nr:hypothetical protein [Paracoccaceae bacterium]
MTQATFFDPKGLMRDAFAIDGISAPECRSIFLDWALGIPADLNTPDEARKVLAHYAPLHVDGHPMLETLQGALQESGPARRRGGRQGRLSGSPESAESTESPD